MKNTVVCFSCSKDGPGPNELSTDTVAGAGASAAGGASCLNGKWQYTCYWGTTLTAVYVPDCGRRGSAVTGPLHVPAGTRVAAAQQSAAAGRSCSCSAGHWPVQCGSIDFSLVFCTQVTLERNNAIVLQAILKKTAP